MRLIVRLLILITPLAADIPIVTAKLGLNGAVTVVYSFLLFASSLAFLLLRGGQYPAIVILYLLGIGATEAVPSLYWFSTFFIVLILTSWMIMRTPCRISFHDINLPQKALLNGNTCHKKML